MRLLNCFSFDLKIVSKLSTEIPMYRLTISNNAVMFYTLGLQLAELRLPDRLNVTAFGIAYLRGKFLVLFCQCGQTSNIVIPHSNEWKY